MCVFFVVVVFQLIPSKAVAEVSCSSCVSLFFNDVDCKQQVFITNAQSSFN